MSTARRSTLGALILVAAQVPSLHGQDGPGPTARDWSKEVQRACTSPRYGLRLAASKRIASGGDDAVPAIRAFAQQHGANALPVALVEAIAARVSGDTAGTDTSAGASADAATLLLLEEWARDREFFWRAQALLGLIPRQATLARREHLLPLFETHADDPAWLVRAHARAGLVALGRNRRPADDPDPRARTRLAALTNQAAALVEALGDERTFLGDPWGRRRAHEAFAALRRLGGKDWGYAAEATFDDNRAALRAIADEFSQPPVERCTDPEVAFVGGIEILSCRSGDLFVRWTADGALSGGVAPVHGALLRLDPARWQQLSDSAAALELPAQSGVVICDRMRLQLGSGPAQSAAAPTALPAPAADWLKQLAAAIEEAGATELAGALRDRLAQFVVR